MNHVYKVVYNHATHTQTVVSELAKSSTKKSVRSAVNSALWKAFAGSVLVTLGTAAQAGTPQNIENGMIVTDGRTNTSMSKGSGVWDIKTTTVKGKNAFNSFSYFDVNSGKTVNLHIPSGAANLLNLVKNNKNSVINGILNAIKESDGKVGGNVFILNPKGIVIGKDAQVNMDSLVLASPTQEFLDALMDSTGNISDQHTAAVLAGDMPLSTDGLISVKGKINNLKKFAALGNRVEAGESGADVKLTVATGDIVNLTDDGNNIFSNKDIVISAREDINITGQKVEIGEKAELTAGFQSKAYASMNTAAETDKASIKIKTEDNGLEVGGNAEIKIGSNTDMTARDNIALTSESIGGTQWVSVINSKIDIGDNVTASAGKDLTISSTADNSRYSSVVRSVLNYDDGEVQSYIDTGVSFLTKQAFLTLIPGGFDFSGSNVQSNVTIGNAGSFTAGGKNTIQSIDKVYDVVKSNYKYASVGVAFQLADSQINIGSSTIKGNTVNVAADMTASLSESVAAGASMAETGTKAANAIGIAYEKVTNKVSLAEGSLIESTKAAQTTGNATDDVTVRANMDKTFLASTEAKIGRDGAESVSIQIGLSNAENTVDLQGNIKSQGNIKINADMNIAQDTVQASSSDNVGTFVGINDKIGKIRGLKKLSPYLDSAINKLGGDTSLNGKVNFEVTPAVAVSKIENSTGVTVNGIVTGSGITINADLTNNLYTGVIAAITSEKDRTQTDKGIAAAIAYGANIDKANITIGDNTSNRAVLTATGGDITMHSGVNLTKPIADELEKIFGGKQWEKNDSWFNMIKDDLLNGVLGPIVGFADSNAFFLSSQAKADAVTLNESGDKSGDLGIGGTIAVNDIQVESKVTVLDGTAINASQHDVKADAEGRLLGFDYLGASSESKNAVGAGIMYNTYDSDVRATIGKATISNVKKLTVNADDTNLIIGAAYGSASGTTAANAFSGSFVKQKVKSTVYANISNAATITADATEITAKDTSRIITASGNFAGSSAKAFGVGYGWNVIDSDVQAFVGGSTAANGALSLGDVKIQAENKGLIVSVGIAGSKTSDTPSAPPDPPAPDPEAGIELQDLAGDGADGENILNLDEVVEGDGGAGAGGANLDKTSFGLNISGEVAYNAVDTTTKAYIEGSGASTDSLNLKSLDMDAIENVADISVVGAGTFSSSSSSSGTNVAVAGGATANMIDSTIESYIKNIRITASDATKKLDIDTDFEDSVYAIAASASASSQPDESSTVNLAGAVAVNQIKTNNNAYIENAGINDDAGDQDTLADELKVKAKSDPFILSVAGNATVTTGSSGGASVAVDIIKTDTYAYQKNSHTKVKGDTTFETYSRDKIKDIAAGIGLARGNVQVEGSVAVNRIRNTTGTYIEGGTLLSRSGNININSYGTTDIKQYGGEAQLATGESSVGLGVSVDVNVINNDINAYIKNATVTASDASKDVNVYADLDSTVKSYLVSAGGALGAAAIGVNVAVNDVDSDVKSYLEGSSTVINGNLDMDAKNKNRGGVYGGILEIGKQGGVGIYVSTYSEDFHTNATVTDATLNNGLVDLNADTDNLFGAIIVTAGGGSNVAGAGNVGVFNVGGTKSNGDPSSVTLASIDKTTINTTKDVKVNAHDKTVIGESSGGDTVALGGGALGTTGGALAASVGVSTIKNTTTAQVIRSDVTAKNLDVTSHAEHEINTYIVTVGVAQYFAAAASVDVNRITSNTYAYIGQGAETTGKKSTIDLAGNLNLSADTDDIVRATNWTGELNYYYGAALGAGVSVLKTNGNTWAKINGDTDITAAGTVDVTADVDRTIKHLAVGISGGFISAHGSVGVISVGSAQLEEEITDDLEGAQQDSSSVLQKAKVDIKALATDQTPDGTAAEIDSNVSIKSTGTGDAKAVSVMANDTTGLDTTIGYVGGGAGAVGASVNVVDIDTNTTALYRAKALETGKLTVSANNKVEEDGEGLRTFSGSGGIAAVNGNHGQINSTNEVRAQIDGTINKADTVKVKALSDYNVKNKVYGAALGGIGVSGVRNKNIKDGLIDASITGQIGVGLGADNIAGTTDDDHIGTIDIQAVDQAIVDSYSLSAGGGVGAGFGADSTSTLEDVLRSEAGTGTSSNIKADTLNVQTQSTQKLNADVDAVSAGGVVVGVSLTDVNNTISNTAVLGGKITAGNITANAHQDKAENVSMSYAVAGAVVGAGGAQAKSNTKGTIQTFVNDGANIRITGNGTLDLLSDGDTNTFARADGRNGGVAAGGGTHPIINTDVTRLVKTGQAQINAAEGSVKAKAAGTDGVWGISRLGSGGAVAASAAKVYSSEKSTTKVVLNNTVLTAKTLDIDAQHNTRQRSFVYTGSGSLVGGVGNYIENVTDDTVKAEITGSTITAFDTDIDADATFKNEFKEADVDAFSILIDKYKNDVKDRWVDKTYALDSDSGGAVDVNRNGLEWRAYFDTGVDITDSHIKPMGVEFGQGSFDVRTTNNINLDERMIAANGGAVAVMLATNQIDLKKAQTAINISKSDVFTYGDAVLKASSDITLNAQTDATSGGVGAGVDADTYLRAQGDGDIKNLINFSDGSTLTANTLKATAANNTLNIHALTQTWNKGVVTGNNSNVPVVAYNLTDRININTGSNITTFGTADFGVGEGAIDTSGRLWSERSNAWDWIKGLFSGDFTTVTTKNSTVSRTADTQIYIDGHVTAGLGNGRIITVNGDGSVSYNKVGIENSQPKVFTVTETRNADGTYLKVTKSGDTVISTETIAASEAYVKDEQFDLYQYYADQIKKYQDAIAAIGDMDPTGVLKAKYEALIGEFKRDGVKAGVMDENGNKVGTGMTAVASLPDINLSPVGVILRSDTIKNGSNAKITINSDASISVANNSAETLRINNLTIRSESDLTAPLTVIGKGQYSGVLDVHASGNNYGITVDNNQNGLSLPTQIQVNGTVESLKGSIKITNRTGGDIRISDDGSVTGDSVAINAGTGNVEIDKKSGTSQQQYAPIYSLTKAGSATPAVVSGANVTIKGWALNINGTINAGISSYNLTLPETLMLLTADGQETTVDAVGDEGRYAVKLTDSDNVNAWYNAATKQIEVDDVMVKGGYLELEGGIINTGEGGVLNVMDGYASINITNNSGKDVVLNTLDIGAGVDGVLKITDYALKAKELSLWEELFYSNWTYVDDADKTVSVFSRNNGVITQTVTVNGGSPVTTTINASSTTYTPADVWVFKNNDGTYKFDKYNLIDRISGKHVETNHPIAINFEGNESYGTVNVTSNTTAGTGNIYLTNKVGGEGDVRVTINAKDNIVSGNGENTNKGTVHGSAINLTSGSGKIDTQVNMAAAEGLTYLKATSGSDIAITATAGDLFIDAVNANSGQNAVTLSSDGGIYGQAVLAKTVTGTDISQVSGSNGDLIYQNKKLYLKKENAWTEIDNDATAVADGYWGMTSDGKGLYLKTDGNNQTVSPSVKASEVTLNAASGSIGLSVNPILLTPAEGTDPSITVTAAATAGQDHSQSQVVSQDSNSGGIYLKQTDGDMHLIKTDADGDVSITADAGSIIDSNEQEENYYTTAQDMLDKWKDAGLYELTDKQLVKEIEDYDARRQGEYSLYWNAVNNGQTVDGSSMVFGDIDVAYLKGRGYSDDQIEALKTASLMEQLAAFYRYSYDNGTRTEAAYDKAYQYDISNQTRTLQADRSDTYVRTEKDILGDAAGWTKDSLTTILNIIAKNDDTVDTRYRLEDDNVDGNNVTLYAKKEIGEPNQSVRTIVLSSDGKTLNALTDEEKLIISSAEYDDATFVSGDDGSVILKIQMSEDLNVKADGVFNATAETGSLLIGSEKDLKLGTVTAKDEVQIKTRGSIVNGTDSAQITAGNNVVLEAAGGSIGAENNAVKVRYTNTDAIVADTIVSRSLGDTWLDLVSDIGEIGVDYLLADHLTLKTEAALYNYRFEDNINVRASDVDITAKSIGYGTTLGNGQTEIDYFNIAVTQTETPMQVSGDARTLTELDKLSLASRGMSDDAISALDAGQTGVTLDKQLTELYGEAPYNADYDYQVSIKEAESIKAGLGKNPSREQIDTAIVEYKNQRNEEYRDYWAIHNQKESYTGVNLTATDGDIYVRNTSENLYVESIAATVSGAVIDLQGNNIYSSSNVTDHANIVADTVNMKAAGSIGNTTTIRDIAVLADTFNASAGTPATSETSENKGNIFITLDKKHKVAGDDAIEIGSISATGSVGIVSEVSLDKASSTSELKSGGDMTLLVNGSVGTESDAFNISVGESLYARAGSKTDMRIIGIDSLYYLVSQNQMMIGDDVYNVSDTGVTIDGVTYTSVNVPQTEGNLYLATDQSIKLDKLYANGDISLQVNGGDITAKANPYIVDQSVEDKTLAYATGDLTVNVQSAQDPQTGELSGGDFGTSDNPIAMSAGEDVQITASGDIYAERISGKNITLSSGDSTEADTVTGQHVTVSAGENGSIALRELNTPSAALSAGQDITVARTDEQTGKLISGLVQSTDFTALTAGGVVTIIGGENTDITSSAGITADRLLLESGNDITLTGLTKVTDTASLKAGNDITVTQLDTAKAAFIAGSDITVAQYDDQTKTYTSGLLSATELLQVTAGDDVRIVGSDDISGSSVSADNIALTAAGTVDITTLDAQKAIAINADEDIKTTAVEAETVTAVAGKDFVSDQVVVQNADISAGNDLDIDTLRTTQDADLTSGGDTSLGIVQTGGGITVTAGDNIDFDTVAATGNAVLQSGTSSDPDVTGNMTGTSLTANDIDLDAKGTIDIGNLKSTGKIDADAGGDVKVDSAEGKTVIADAGNDLEIGKITASESTSLDAGNDIKLGDVTTGAMTADAGDNMTFSDITATGNVVLQSGTSTSSGITGNMTGDTLTADNADLDAAGTIDIQHINVDSQLTADAGKDFISDQVIAQDADISAGNDLDINTLRTTQDADLTSGRDTSLGTVQTGGGITVTAGDNIDFDTITATGDATMKSGVSNAAGITGDMTGNTLTANNIDLDAKGIIDIKNLNSKEDITVKTGGDFVADTISARNADITAGKDIDINTLNASNRADLDAGNDLNVDNLNTPSAGITAGRDATLDITRDIQLNPMTVGRDLSLSSPNNSDISLDNTVVNRNISVTTGGDINLGTVTSRTGNINATSTSGNITVEGPVTAQQGNTSLDAEKNVISDGDDAQVRGNSSTLIAGTGNVGSHKDPVNVGDTVTAEALNGSVYITNPKDVDMNGIKARDTIEVTAGRDITDSSGKPLSAKEVTLKAGRDIGKKPAPIYINSGANISADAGRNVFIYNYGNLIGGKFRARDGKAYITATGHILLTDVPNQNVRLRTLDTTPKIRIAGTDVINTLLTGPHHDIHDKSMETIDVFLLDPSRFTLEDGPQFPAKDLMGIPVINQDGGKEFWIRTENGRDLQFIEARR